MTFLLPGDKGVPPIIWLSFFDTSIRRSCLSAAKHTNLMQLYKNNCHWNWSSMELVVWKREWSRSCHFFENLAKSLSRISFYFCIRVRIIVVWQWHCCRGAVVVILEDALPTKLSCSWCRQTNAAFNLPCSICSLLRNSPSSDMENAPITQYQPNLKKLSLKRALCNLIFPQASQWHSV